MIKIAIVGAGRMAGGHVTAFKKIRGCRVVACCDLVAERAREFAARHAIPAAFNDLDEMLARADLDAVSNVTNDPVHCVTSLKIMAAGKHVLCEKPLATGYTDAKRMADAARRAGVINMVNFSYRRSAALNRISRLVADGRLGRIMHFEASYLQSWLTSDYWGAWRSTPSWLWRLSRKHGSNGVMGDLGVHILDLVMCPLGNLRQVTCRLATFDKAKNNRVGEYRLDANDSAMIIAEMECGACGVIHASRWATGHKNSLKLEIHGEKGAVALDLDQSFDTYRVCIGKDVNQVAWREQHAPKVLNNQEGFIQSIRTGVNAQPDFAAGARVQKVLDACFESDARGRTVKI